MNTQIHRRIQSGSFAVHCQDCSIGELCLPLSLTECDLQKLDQIMQRKKPIAKGSVMIKANDSLSSLYAIRSGCMKSYVITEQGKEQITGFYLAGDIFGFDAIGSERHPTTIQALETSMVCDVPYHNLDQLFSEAPEVRRLMMRLMSEEIRNNQQMILLLSQKNAEQKLATFIYSLSRRFIKRGFSGYEFKLAMSRSDISNYLGLTIETISRLLTRLQQLNVLSVKGKHIVIRDMQTLIKLSGESLPEIHCSSPSNRIARDIKQIK